MLHLALLGDPVAHSLSPRLHRAALRSVNLDGTYDTRRVDADGMRQAVENIRRGLLDGANVTMPHKRLAAELCDELGDRARRAQSVNTLVRSAAGVRGENTDVTGVEEAWNGLPDGPVLVMGAGGAAAAAVLALEGRPLHISARRQAAGRSLLDRLGVEGDVVPWGRGVAGAVVVNATPIGMHGEELPADVLEPASGLFDMPYGSSETPAVAAMSARGLPVVAGVEMLLNQAAASFHLWTGLTPSLASMRAALA